MSALASYSVPRKKDFAKVIVRTRKGEIFQGFTSQVDIKPEFPVIDRTGKEKSFRLEEVKAVFFVKDFKGDSAYEEVKFLKKKPESRWIWVRVVLFDGEVLEGSTENSLELLRDPGFFLRPSDSDANNDLVFVPKTAVESFSVLCVE